MTFFGPTIDKIILAIVIFTFFQFFRAFFRKILLNILRKIASKTKNTLDNELIEVIQKPIDFLFIAIGAKIAVDVLPLSGDLSVFADHSTASLFAFAIFWAIYNIVDPFTRVIHTFSNKFGKELSEDVYNFIIKSIRFFIIAIGFMTILQEWGYNVSGFLASLGLVGMAFALAAKDTAANLFGSLVIFTDKPFKVGDWIKTPSVEGTVEKIGIRSTKVRTFAQALVTVPNAVLANSAILNWSRMGKRRIKMKLGLTYGTSTETMEKIIKEIKQMLSNHPDINKETMHIYFTDFDDSSLGIFCYYFTNSTDWGEYMRVREDTNFKIMKIVKDNGADFAFPSRSVYIENGELN